MYRYNYNKMCQNMRPIRIGKGNRYSVCVRHIFTFFHFDKIFLKILFPTFNKNYYKNFQLINIYIYLWDLEILHRKVIYFNSNGFSINNPFPAKKTTEFWVQKLYLGWEFGLTVT